MPLLVQNLVCLFILGAALLWLARHFGLVRAGKSSSAACASGCGKCAAAPAGPEQVAGGANLVLRSVRRFRLRH